MGWIKRNLLFVVIGVVALAALGGAGFVIYRGYTSNAENSQRLNEIYGQLQEIAQKQPQPGDDKINNTQLAKEQDQQLRNWINQAVTTFRPIAPIPAGEVTSKSFATALGSTIYQLQQDAKENSVTLPAQYCFSFQAQNGLLTISSGLVPLAQQLGEVKAIAEILFAARINNLDSIQRVRVSEDDVNKGAETDYTDKTPITNELAVITPYVVTFRTFTPDLAKVISGFANSTNPFVVKSVLVQPASAEPIVDNGAAATPGYGNGYGMRPPPGVPLDRWLEMHPVRRGVPGMPGEQPQQPNQAVAGKGGLQTVIKEQLLRVTLEVDIVKLLPKS